MGPIRSPRWEQKRTEGYVIVSNKTTDTEKRGSYLPNWKKTMQHMENQNKKHKNRNVMEQIKIFVREYFNFRFAYVVITYYSLQFLSNGDTK
jgi:hypothetical protein